MAHANKTKILLDTLDHIQGLIPCASASSIGDRAIVGCHGLELRKYGPKEGFFPFLGLGGEEFKGEGRFAF